MATQRTATVCDGAKAMVISILFAVSSVCAFFEAPLVGKIIDRFGYEIVMVMDTLILVIVCFFYSFAHQLFDTHTAFVVYCVNYILKSVISLASMASNIYVQNLSDSADEVRATISTWVSVNHMITIMIALFADGSGKTWISKPCSSSPSSADSATGSVKYFSHI